MEVRIACWADPNRSKINKRSINVSPIAYRTASYAYWKILVADEDVKLEKGKVAFVNIESIELPGNTLVSPLSIVRHAYGVVLDTYELCPPRTKIEEPKNLQMVAFLPIEDGEIKKGDMVGVVKVFVVGVGPVEAMSRVKAADAKVELEELDVCMVHRVDGEVRRECTKVREYMYRRRHMAEWMPLVADEDVEVREGEVTVVKIKDVLIPPETIPVPLSIKRHAYGVVVDVMQPGRPGKVEEEKIITHAVFVPVMDGEIKKGDLIGVLNVYYISLKDKMILTSSLPASEATLVYWEGDKVVRKEIELRPFGYKRSSIGRLEPLVAAEDVEVKAGEIVEVKIEEVNLPAGTVVQPLLGRNHAIGILLDVSSSEPPKRVEDDKKIDSAIFFAVSDGKIERGDLIGVLNIYHVAIVGLDMLLTV